MREYQKISGFADEIDQNLTVQIESLNKLGIRYVEMRGVDGQNLIYHSDEKVTEIKNRLDEAGIRLSAIGSPLGKIGIDEDFEPHFEAFKRAVEIAHRMDVRNIRMFSFYVPWQEMLANPGCKENVKERVMGRIGRFVSYAAAEDVVLLHENEKGIYGEKAPECKELTDAYAGEHFKAIFDFANFVQAGQDTLAAYELLKDHIAYIHVKDALSENGQVVPAGYGDGNVAVILRKLFERGFDGFFSLEPHLFDFTGFTGLERGTSKIETAPGKALSGYEAFALAHSSLLKVLESVG